MAILKRVLKEGYKDNELLQKLVGYPFENERAIESGCYGVTSIKEAVHQMQLTKELYDKTDGVQLHHLILTFKDRECVTTDMAEEIAWDYVSMHNDTQSVFGVHDEEGKVHIHFVMNSVSPLDGLKLRKFDNHSDLKNDFGKVLEKYDIKLDPIIRY